jgi:hypothetical protein
MKFGMLTNNKRVFIMPLHHQFLYNSLIFFGVGLNSLIYNSFIWIRLCFVFYQNHFCRPKAL